MNNIVVMPMIIPLLTGILLVFLRPYVLSSTGVQSCFNRSNRSSQCLYFEPDSDGRYFTARFWGLVATLRNFICRGFILYATCIDDSDCNRNSLESMRSHRLAERMRICSFIHSSFS